MIFSIVLLILIGLIGYFHYVQGLLSGLISAVLAICAAMMAMAYYEPLAETLSGGKFNDASQGVVLISLFVLVYILGRVLFDKLVPGNVRLPHLVDAIGGAICGVVAAVFATGIIAIGFQSMPFSASIFGYTRYPLSAEGERQVSVPGPGGRNVDRIVYDELKNDDLESAQESLIFPVDDIVIGTTRHLSNGGSLAGGKEFEAIHPNLLQELFGQRLGIEAGAKRTAINKNGTQVTIEGANLINQPLRKFIGEFAKELRREEPKGNLVPESGKYVVSVTVMFKKDAADEDFRVRLSPGSVRLCAKTSEGWRNYYPIGTVQQGQVWLNKPDDPLFIDVSKEDRGAHFLFQVDTSIVVGNVDAKPSAAASAAAAAAAELSFVADSFIEVKRLKLPLDRVKLTQGKPTDAARYFPMRKTKFYTETADPAQPQPTADTTPQPQPQPTTPTPPAAAPGTPSAENGWIDAPLEKPVMSVSAALPVGINPGMSDPDGDVATTSVDGQLTGRKFSILNVDVSQPGSALAELPKGGAPVKDLFVPDGMRMIQVKLTVKPNAQPWAWSNISEYVIADERGISTLCHGLYAVITHNGAQKLYCHYKANAPPAVTKLDGATASEVTLIFLHPKAAKAVELQYQVGRHQGGLPLEK